MIRREEITDQAWQEIEPLLPKYGQSGGQWRDHRTVVNGILWKLRTGSPWRDLPERDTVPGRPATTAWCAGGATAPGTACSPTPRPEGSPAHLLADRGYSFQSCRRLLRRRGICHLLLARRRGICGVFRSCPVGRASGRARRHAMGDVVCSLSHRGRKLPRAPRTHRQVRGVLADS